MIKEESDLDQGTSQVFTLKEEPLTDMKNDYYDAMSPSVFVSEDKVSSVLFSFRMSFSLIKPLIRCIAIGPILMFDGDSCKR